MMLSIDTTDRNLLQVTLFDQGGLLVAEQEATGAQQAHQLLPIIRQLLVDQGQTFADLTEIKVATGPGSFTGTRVGVTVANALAWSLQIPVNGLPVGTMAEVVYAEAPKITLPR